MEKILLTGNEAIARGVWEAGCHVVASYPGTPSTEITENTSKYPEIHSEWAPNEKVALEVAIGASIAGGRALSCMKHVGLNVAADPLFTVSYTGVTGGLVIANADDPGQHSSQNEQDNRNYGRAAKIPVLEPSDSQECLDFAKIAFDLSEKYDTPVILRTTTRIAHSQSLVETGDRVEKEIIAYQKNIQKYVMVPANAKVKHHTVEARTIELAKIQDFNRIEWNDKKLGVITAGVTYQYVKEVLPEASILKIGMPYPLNKEMVEEFAAGVERLVVIEELDPFLEDTIKAWGINCEGKNLFSMCDEIMAADIAAALAGGKTDIVKEDKTAPVRPPVLCPGCPHRGTFFVLNQLKCVVNGDIGCYTLGCGAPLSAMDATVCMGYSVSGVHGMEMAAGRDFAKKSVAVIGDSTFMHSGVTGLINTVYNGGTSTTLILDNSITAMTGHQDNPTTGRNAQGEIANAIDLEMLVRGCGVKRVAEVDPFDLKKMREVVKAELEAEEPSVVLVRRPCILLDKEFIKPAYEITDKCKQCGNCLRIGCPAIVKTESGIYIDQDQCVGCGLCESLCGFGAMVQKEK